VPGVPQLLWGEGADVWRRATESSIDDADADDATRDVLQALESLGLVVRSESPGVSATQASKPWLTSFQHELVYALLTNAARQVGVEIIFIKGPVLHEQGLRAREHSGDVDCWVRPSDEKALIQIMTEWGWTATRTAFDGTAIPHSRTLIPGEWGCEIDVHTRFPGMTVEPAAAFDHVLRTAEVRTFAGNQALVPARAVHAVIYGLHELRPVSGRSHDEDSQERTTRAFDVAGVATIAAVEQLGAGYVLGDALRRSFPSADLSRLSVVEPSDWRWRSIASVPRRQLAALRMIPVGQRPRVLFRLLWPAADASQRTREAAAEGAANLLLVKVRRLRDGLTRLARND
jgi:hypothetical protein